jgi:hypothetical protein
MKEFIIDKNQRLNTIPEFTAFSKLFPTTDKEGMNAYIDKIMYAYFNDFEKSTATHELYDLDYFYEFIEKELTSIDMLTNVYYYEEYELKIRITLKRYKENPNTGDHSFLLNYYQEQLNKYFIKMLNHFQNINETTRNTLFTHLIRRHIKREDPKWLSKGICRTYDCIRVIDKQKQETYFRFGKEYLTKQMLIMDLFFDGKAVNREIK